MGAANGLAANVQEPFKVGRPEADSERSGAEEAVVLDPSRLSARERDVLALLSEGHSRGEIARRLHRSPKTIDNHCTRIYDKLGVHSQAQLVRFMHEQGLAGPAFHVPARSVPFSDDAPMWKAYGAIVRELGAAEGVNYFDVLTRCLCEALGVEFSGVSEYDDEAKELVVIAALMDGSPVGTILCPSNVSPCAVAMRKGEIVCNGDTLTRFPQDEPLKHYGANTYIGVGLQNHWLGDLGTMWVASRRPVQNAGVIVDVLKLLRHQVATAIAFQVAVDRLSECGVELAYRQIDAKRA